MRKAMKWVLGVSSILFILSAAAAVMEFCGWSVCFFGRPVHAWLALPLIVSVVALTVCFCRLLSVKQDTGADKVLKRMLQTVLCLLCAVFVVAAAGISAANAVSYSESDLAADKNHKLFVEENASFGDPTVYVYKRYSPFLMSYRNSAVLYGFSGDLDSITVQWEDTYCEVFYSGYADDAQSAADEQTLSRKIYYVPETISTDA